MDFVASGGGCFKDCFVGGMEGVRGGYVSQFVLCQVFYGVSCFMKV